LCLVKVKNPSNAVKKVLFFKKFFLNFYVYFERRAPTQVALRMIRRRLAYQNVANHSDTSEKKI
jgi:hypothetical protein